VERGNRHVRKKVYELEQSNQDAVLPVPRRPIWIGLGALLLIALVLITWFSLPLSDWLRALGEWARRQGSAGVVIISIMYIAGTTMTLVVAIIYGWWALAICFLGGLLAALISFLFARHLARDLVKRLLRKHAAAKAVDTIAHQETFKTILLARLTPITPFAVENYAFGVTGARPGAYLLATAVGIVPGTILNVWLGVIGRTATQGEASAASWTLLTVGLVATFVLTTWMTRQVKRKLGKHREARTADQACGTAEESRG
jgi:uncharacterized membrane protein YdjX (TVP38/TMEM64 family)